MERELEQKIQDELETIIRTGLRLTPIGVEAVRERVTKRHYEEQEQFKRNAAIDFDNLPTRRSYETHPSKLIGNECYSEFELRDSGRIK